MDGSLISDSAAEKILAEARKRFKISVEAERENRTAAMDDMASKGTFSAELLAEVRRHLQDFRRSGPVARVTGNRP